VPGDLLRPNVAILPPAGLSGIPSISVDAQGRLVISFLRLRASMKPGIAYAVETGSELQIWSDLNLASATVVPLNAIWERVTVTDPTTPGPRFGRVRVQVLNP